MTRCRGNAIQAEPVCRYDTDPEAVMNIGLHPKEPVFACGMSEKCQLLFMKEDHQKHKSNEDVRKRTGGNDGLVNCQMIANYVTQGILMLFLSLTKM